MARREVWQALRDHERVAPTVTAGLSRAGRPETVDAMRMTSNQAIDVKLLRSLVLVATVGG
jgi:hypothetical protein